MALSNIFNEPRREITESVVGIALFAALAWADYEAAVWIQNAFGLDAWGRRNFPWQIGMVVIPIAAFFAALVLVLSALVTHAVGDGICNALQERGIHLRPRQRR